MAIVAIDAGLFCRGRQVAEGVRERLCAAELTDEQLRWERVALGLRTSAGIATSELGDGSADLENRVAGLFDQGLVEQIGSRLVPTLRGMLVADAMARCLLFGSRS